ncbi:hypothetical protein CDAR_479441 [Caerostris darwini]|uniref:BTB domain-containing protein n=1 Tax=Caerostris darwini TaxID=1538125 RepID=A0AAV4MTB7_9ARAC|nr:hypothetical protein CDAR_479441 [Caerostris darwini]
MAEGCRSVTSEFDFTWDIECFEDHVRKRFQEIFSPTFELKCVHVMRFFIRLKLNYTEDDYRLAFSMFAVGGSELREITTMLEMSVASEDGGRRFEKSCPLYFPDECGDERECPFVERGAALLEHLSRGRLRLHCRLAVSVHPARTAKFNFSANLQNLSNQMEALRLDASMRESVITVRGESFGVHQCVLLARWPNYPDYLGLFKKDLIAPDLHSGLQVIRLSALVEAAAKISPLEINSKECREKAADMYDLLSPRLFDYLLSYVYSGRLRRISPAEKLKVVRVGRYFGFKELVERLQEVPTASTGVTRCTSEAHSIEWHCEDTRRWRESRFRPVTQIINAYKEARGSFEVTFFMENQKQHGDIMLEVCFSSSDLPPAAVSCLITVMKVDFSSVRQSSFAFFAKDFEDPAWRIPVGLSKLDLRDTLFRVEFSFSNASSFNQNGTGIVSNVFELSANEVEIVPCLLSYSYQMDFFYEEAEAHDTELIAEDKVVKAHRHILSVRSPRFRRDLARDLKRPGVIKHFVNRVGFDALVEMVRYLYTGGCHLQYLEGEGKPNLAQDLCIAGLLYELPDLKEKCYQRLRRRTFRRVAKT